MDAGWHLEIISTGGGMSPSSDLSSLPRQKRSNGADLPAFFFSVLPFLGLG